MTLESLVVVWRASPHRLVCVRLVILLAFKDGRLLTVEPIAVVALSNKGWPLLDYVVKVDFVRFELFLDLWEGLSAHVIKQLEEEGIELLQEDVDAEGIFGRFLE